MAKETKVSIDKEICIGCQHCVEMCPKVFTYNSDEGVAEVNQSGVDGCDSDVKDLAKSCPVGAIGVN